MIDTSRYTPAYMGDTRMWHGRCKEHPNSVGLCYYDNQTGEWDWPFRCEYCDLGEPVPPPKLTLWQRFWDWWRKSHG